MSDDATPNERTIDGVRDLLNEVDCRVEHGAASGGHLEYVRERLRAILADAYDVAPCDLDPSGRPYGF